MKRYFAITEHGSIALGNHENKEAALDFAVDKFNIHQAENYLIVNEFEAFEIVFNLGEQGVNDD